MRCVSSNEERRDALYQDILKLFPKKKLGYEEEIKRFRERKEW